MVFVDQLFDRDVFQAGAICFDEGQHIAHGLTRIGSRDIYLRFTWNFSFGHGRNLLMLCEARGARRAKARDLDPVLALTGLGDIVRGLHEH